MQAVWQQSGIHSQAICSSSRLNAEDVHGQNCERMNMFIPSKLCRPTAHELSCWENVIRQILNEGIHTNFHKSTQSPQTVGQLPIQSMDRQPTAQKQSLNCWPTAHGQSMDWRPTVYRLAFEQSMNLCEIVVLSESSTSKQRQRLSSNFQCRFWLPK